MPSTLTRPARHDGRSRTPPSATPDAQPYIPWRLHAYRPRPTPLLPDPAIDRGRPPAPWPTQCRDCWGFVDDPRHLTPLPDKSLERG